MYSMTITAATPVADIATTIPSSVRVLQRHGIDFCCGGRRPIGAVCTDQGLALADVVRDIEAAAAQPGPDVRDWTRETLQALTDHIVATYHDALRDELPRLELMASKVAKVHGAKAPHLSQLAYIVGELAADLSLHMQKEEQVLFPAIRAIEIGDGHRSQPDWIALPITVLQEDHDRAGELLAQLRSITSGYQPPEWACGTMRALYGGLDEFEQTMHVHVHLENNVLFPRALQHAERAAVRA
jgi:regulator of cell morphogenesis and NO signaling